MAKNLVIIESPNKSKSIQKYLEKNFGRDYKVIASFGHIRQLIDKGKGIDVEKDFKMVFTIDPRKKKVVDEILDQAKAADTIWLATDPDREGEAISWHIHEIIKSKIKDAKIVRVTFSEITERAVLEAMKHPRELNMNLVHAQQSRQIIDYLFGFNVSPLLWRKVANGTSAGRVQSPSVRLIDERETEIQNFRPDEYWNVWMQCLTHTQNKPFNFKAKLIEHNGEKLTQFSIRSESQALSIKKDLIGQSGVVTDIKTKPNTRRPQAPFTTSTLQQAAGMRLGFSSHRTMSTAQTLFESVSHYNHGLITYMRTDSVVISQEALNSIRAYIPKHYQDALPDKPNFYQSKSKNTQEAHEAIRPVDINITPNDVKPHVNDDMYRLYKLIWERTVASQMSDAHYLVTTVAIKVKSSLFRVTGRVLTKPGFLQVYQDVDDPDQEKEDNQTLPPLELNQAILNEGIDTTQHFTKPPPRFNEHSLVKTLDDHGIGRPSTYASIIQTIKDRGYVSQENRRFMVSDKGHLVIRYLKEHFKPYMDYEFTARMENDLDEIAQGKINHLEFIRRFWNELTKIIQSQKDAPTTDRGILARLDENCPECNHQLLLRVTRYGRLIGCSNYPECKYSRRAEEKAEDNLLDRNCPDCGAQLRENYSARFKSKFVGCSNYPTCTYIEKKPKQPVEDTGRVCPSCKKHNLVKRQGKFGPMIACSGYPKCRFIEKKDKKKKS